MLLDKKDGTKLYTRMVMAPTDAKQTRALTCMAADAAEAPRCERLFATLGVVPAP